MTPADYLEAARVPPMVRPQSFGLWTISRLPAPDSPEGLQLVGWPDYTVLRHATAATLHLGEGVVVMEDSRPELRKHLPIWLAARGRVLVTGLGLGCVVRGLLASPHVEHIDVVELDPGIIRVVGAEFVANPRVSLHKGDALKVALDGARWDFGWHDLWVEGSGLQRMHLQLIDRFHKRCPRQGAWNFPRWAARLMRRGRLGIPLGSPGYQRRTA